MAPPRLGMATYFGSSFHRPLSITRGIISDIGGLTFSIIDFNRAISMPIYAASLLSLAGILALRLFVIRLSVNSIERITHTNAKAYFYQASFRDLAILFIFLIIEA